MPVPINSISDIPISNGSPEKSYQVDYSFLAINLPKKSDKKIVQASNRDADLLFEIWNMAEKSDSKDTFKINPSMATMRDVMRLKTLGLVKGSSNNVTFTERGKAVVSAMVMGETSSFEKNSKKKSYSEILASMDKRGKHGYRAPKYASCTSNNIDLRNS
ncbi:MAG: hypothetical protein ACOCUV_01580 [bacterium]